MAFPKVICHIVLLYSLAAVEPVEETFRLVCEVYVLSGVSCLIGGDNLMKLRACKSHYDMLLLFCERNE
jgi:hypothetical protein